MSIEKLRYDWCENHRKGAYIAVLFTGDYSEEYGEYLETELIKACTENQRLKAVIEKIEKRVKNLPTKLDKEWGEEVVKVLGVAMIIHTSKSESECKHDFEDDGDNMQIVCVKCGYRSDVIPEKKPVKEESE